MELTGLAAIASEDPEPEYVSVNRRNQAAPTIVSADDPGGDPIGFGALSGLSGVPGAGARDRLVAVTDNAYTPTRILGVDAGAVPAEVDMSGHVVREAGLPAAVEAGATANGFEGVAVVHDPDGREQMWVAVQREWADNPPGQVTLARFTPPTGA